MSDHRSRPFGVVAGSVTYIAAAAAASYTSNFPVPGAIWWLITLLVAPVVAGAAVGHWWVLVLAVMPVLLGVLIGAEGGGFAEPAEFEPVSVGLGLALATLPGLLLGVMIRHRVPARRGRPRTDEHR